MKVFQGVEVQALLPALRQAFQTFSTRHPEKADVENIRIVLNGPVKGHCSGSAAYKQFSLETLIIGFPKLRLPAPISTLFGPLCNGHDFCQHRPWLHTF